MSQRKEDDERVNRNPRVFPSQELMWDGETRGPVADEDWHPKTQEWWEWLRNSAQAILMQDSDWFILRLAAAAHSQIFTQKKVITKNGEVVSVPITPGELKGLIAEFRATTDTYGLTFQSRQRYGIKVVTPEDAAKEATQVAMADAPPSVDYRTMFGG